MLKFFTRILYSNVYTDEPELFSEIYQYSCGLFSLIELRRVLGIFFFYLISIFWMIFFKTEFIPFVSILIAFSLLCIESKEIAKKRQFNSLGIRTPSQITTIHIQEFIRKFVTKSGKALGKKEWKIIKKYDLGLYNDLLTEECNNQCHYYSLEIAKIITDSTLIWGAAKEIFEKERNYYAHAIIYRNGYIYDSNLRQSIKYEDYIKLFKFKIYKKWTYNEYSQKDFRQSEREGFYNWCHNNNVLSYKGF